ncbi:non-ribosomal peptide synthetase [Phycicoccus sp. M110.8]|uniref:non-ribosomal peptide synthetase n=1 Tax=Phycicoccus sp. M110.8 TaxID=3075433 RepID=UPI0028FD5866|nr:non-ribosomal peptide synthetase [Phycicoccus sp. M110.8]MDU0315609.1 non-ribosomal peptide synthetase [Phycicoccus sp. M110.8]
MSSFPTPSHETTRPRPASRFAAALAEHGDRCAVWTPEGPLTYADLTARVQDAGSALGTGRRLVLLAAENSLDFLVTYLGALASGHVPLVVPGDRPQHHASLVERYSPDVVASRDGAGWQVTHRSAEPAHELHPDLALLLPTSGSTGSPKLVRLSHENLDSNALAIAEALRTRPGDRAATTLPLHYCYGLSVAHSHLAVGASLVLTDLSVVDPCFWRLVDDAGVTTLAGVPHTFELLDRSGFAERHHPSLRVVTQAGGRLAPDAVRRYATLGRSRGWDLFVMYGQTEATARMAVLPPELLDSHAETVGLPVPGGRFRLDPLSELECGLGELVYSGPNVMLGYAEHPGDLARGRDVTELRTGDLGHLRADGTVEVVGRRSRFAKVVGLRIDLDRAERDLAEAGVRAHCVDLGDAVGVVAAEPGSGDAVTDTLTRRHGIPASGVVVLDGADVLVLPTGKPDYPGMAALVEAHRARARAARAEHAGAGAPAALTPQAVAALYRDLLDAPGADERTSFVDLGGDSLSYVEVSLRLERLLGALPAGWHLLSPAELVAAARPSHPGRDLAVDGGRPTPRWRRGWHAVETSVVVRAVAVLLILANHTHLSFVPGGAHTLLALAGFNLARFQLTARPRAERARGIVRSALRIWAPSALWIAVVAVTLGTYDWRNVLLLNQVLGDWARWSPHWHYWFVEALVALLAGAALLLSVPAVDRWERRFPFAFPMALVGVGLLTRYDVVVPDAGPYRGANAYVLIWLFATGWAAARARTVPQRLLVSAVPLLTLPGFWPSMPMRGPTVMLGVLALVWLPAVRLPGCLARAASAVAAASLFVYLTHFVVYPHLMAYSSVLAMAASIAVGIAYHRGWTWLEARGRGTASRVRTHVARARSVRTRAGVGG